MNAWHKDFLHCCCVVKKFCHWLWDFYHFGNFQFPCVDTCFQCYWSENNFEKLYGVVIDRDSMLEFEIKVCQVLVFVAWPQINNVIQYCMLKNKLAFCYESRFSTWSLILNFCKIRATFFELRLVLAETNWYSFSNILIGMLYLYWAKTNHKCSFDGHNFVTIADW